MHLIRVLLTTATVLPTLIQADRPQDFALDARDLDLLEAREAYDDFEPLFARGGDTVKCGECGSTGHTGSDCPNGPGGNENRPSRSRQGSRSGRKSSGGRVVTRDADDVEARELYDDFESLFARGGDTVKCGECGSTGHTGSDCPNGPGGNENRPSRSRQGSRSGRKSSGGRVVTRDLYDLVARGLYDDFGSLYARGGDTVKCGECGSTGHTGSDCPNGPGGNENRPSRSRQGSRSGRKSSGGRVVTRDLYDLDFDLDY